MFWYVYPDVTYRWVSFSKRDGGWIDYDVLKKKRAARKREKKKALEQKENENV